MVVTKEQLEAREKATGHCACGPSQLQRIMACPASLGESVSTGVAEPSVYAQRGTLLHEVTEQALLRGRATVESAGLSKGDASDVFDALDYFYQVRRTCSKDAKVEFEKTGNLGSWGLDHVWGTADVLIQDWSNSRAHIIDWKFGKGVKVYVEENEQLLAYAAIALGFPSSIGYVTLHIAQPGIDHYDSWEISYGKLRDWVFEKLTPSLEEALGPNPSYGPGPKQCRWCPKNNAALSPQPCPARHADANERAKTAFAAVPRLESGIITNKELVDLYRTLVELEQVKKDVYERLLHQWRIGNPVPGMKMVSGRSLRKWKDEEEAFAYLKGLGIPDDDLYKKSPVSPAAVEKINRKLKKDEVFQSFVVKPEGSPQLVDETDKRPPIKQPEFPVKEE